MATSNQVEVSGSAAMVVPASERMSGSRTRPGLGRSVTVKNLGPVIAYLGGEEVTPENGMPINVNGTFNLQLSLLDEIWACTSGSESTISYIETGGSL